MVNSKVIEKIISAKRPLHKYTNGDWDITLYEDGTLLKVTESNAPQYAHPITIDCLITKYCDMGCEYCHEASTKSGKHGDIHTLLEVLKELPKGVELAIGGGNPLSHPDILSFLKAVKQLGLYANLTINQGHMKRFKGLIDKIIAEELVKGIGISVLNKSVVEYSHIPNVVYHLIAGIHDVNILDDIMLGSDTKVLILGFKDYGFGKKFSQEPKTLETIKNWKAFLPKYFATAAKGNRGIISFDNLALEQLHVKRFFKEDTWEMLYQGDDFTQSMYIDAVNQEYAPTSRSINRLSFKACSLLEYFNTFKGTGV